MTLNELFDKPQLNYNPDTHRQCGECGEIKELKHFYKDGKTSNGKYRYRRDCKECYNAKRKQEKLMKRKAKLRTTRG